MSTSRLPSSKPSAGRLPRSVRVVAVVVALATLASLAPSLAAAGEGEGDGVGSSDTAGTTAVASGLEVAPAEARESGTLLSRATAAARVTSAPASPRLQMDSRLQPATSSEAARQETMLWASSGPLALGMGVGQRVSANAAGGGAARMIVGVAVATGEHSALTLQSLSVSPVSPASWTPASPIGPNPDPTTARGLLGDDARQLRVGWQLRSANPRSALRGGALNFEINSQTALLVKPRIGRVGVLLTSRW